MEIIMLLWKMRMVYDVVISSVNAFTTLIGTVFVVNAGNVGLYHAVYTPPSPQNNGHNGEKTPCRRIIILMVTTATSVTFTDIII